MHHIGPVPVSAVKKATTDKVGPGLKGKGEQKREKGGQGPSGVKSRERVRSNEAEYVISEVNSDLRFLRVSKSYASITNRVLSVALVRHNEVGVRLVAGDGVSTDPINVTSCYKFSERRDDAPPTHLSLPTRDCQVEVSTGDSGKLGEEVNLSVTVTNHGHFLRTLDGKVEGHIIR